jgi:hypothetical protein
MIAEAKYRESPINAKAVREQWEGELCITSALLDLLRKRGRRVVTSSYNTQDTKGTLPYLVPTKTSNSRDSKRVVSIGFQPREKTPREQQQQQQQQQSTI